MRKYLGIFLFLVLSGVLGRAAQAAKAPPTEAEKMQLILSRTEALEKEIQSLKSQLHAMKAKQITSRRAPTKRAPSHTKPESAATGTAVNLGEPLREEAIEVHYYDGAPVVISPFLGLRSEFDHNDLIVHISDINTDLRLLKQRQRLYNQQIAQGLPVPKHIILELSGLVEAQAFLRDPEHGRTRGDIDLASSELDVAAEIGQWANGFIAMNYDNSATSPKRTSNSRFFLDRGFITVGNLNTTPIYGTVGQFFIPFGQYDSHMLSATLPQSLAKTKVRGALLGYQASDSNPWNAAIYGYHGDTRHGQNGEYGLNIGKDMMFGDVSTNMGVGYSSNLAESNRMQFTGNGDDGFAGFAASSSAERLSRRVPAADVHGSLKIGDYDFIAEYLAATHRFSAHDLTFNGHGARPQAFDAEANYNFKLADFPSSFAVGYGATRQALTLGLPREYFLATVNTALWPGTIESIEFRHDINYGEHDTGFGRAGTTGMLAGGTGSSRTSNMVTAQIGVYF